MGTRSVRRGLTAFPYFGSKALVAEPLWEAFGVDVANYIEPFCGSCAVLLARPTPGKIETVNDAHAFRVHTVTWTMPALARAALDEDIMERKRFPFGRSA